MRRRSVLFLTSLALLPAHVAVAQPRPPEVLPARSLSVIDVGVRGTALTGDAARFQRYRDLGDGLFLDALRVTHEGTDWLLTVDADHAGRRDQRYSGTFAQSGRLQLALEWDQIPLSISRDTRTLFRTEAAGVLRIDDGLRQGVESGALSIAEAVERAVRFDTGSRRDTGRASLVYSPTTELDVTFRWSRARREGTMPFGGSFGFGSTVEVPAPIDTRTTDMTVDLEWANHGALFRLGYDGSWFDNQIPALVWDNPARITDTPAGAARGRLALPPGNVRHAVSSAASVRLPRRSRLTGSVTIGALSQNEPLLPYTVNSAVTPIPLPRTTAEVRARTAASTVSLTSRPGRLISLTTRYRYHDFDNRTPHFPVDRYVRFDQATVTLPAGGPLAYSVTRQNFDADVSFTPLRHTALKAGYGRAHVDRTFRVFETTVEDVVRASVDATGHRHLGGRILVERASREGRGLDLHVLELAGEQPGMRHHDVASRDRTRVTALVNLTPAPALGVNASVAAGKDDYKDSELGLRDNTHRTYGIAFDLVPRDELALGASYNYENYAATHLSRQAATAGQFVDPSRNWATDSDDRVHTVTGSLDLLRLWPGTEIRLAYDVSRSTVTYMYTVGAAADGTGLPSTLPPPAQLPPARSEFQRGTLDGRYFLTERWAMGLVYWYDRFRVQDFGLANDRLAELALPGAVLLGSLYQPYRAHSVWVRLTYLW